jgi:glycerophosphoryl diester phosphodiesterase
VPARIRRDHRAGCRVLAWTVNREDVARRLLARGVDGLITDEPARMLDLVRAERQPA